MSALNVTFELFVARRYLRAKRKQAVISVITVISIIGVAAGVMALVIAHSDQQRISQHAAAQFARRHRARDDARERAVRGNRELAGSGRKAAKDSARRERVARPLWNRLAERSSPADNLPAQS